MALTASQQAIVISELEQGKSLRKACETADIPNIARWFDAISNDSALGDQYARAKEIGWHIRADDIEDKAEDMSIPADHKRIMVDTRKWMLSKMLPKIYGDRLNLEHSGKVQTEQALTDAELAAIAAKGK